MKIIFNGFFYNPSLNQSLIKIIEEFKFSKCHTFACADSQPENFPSHTNVVVYDYHEIAKGEYSNVEWSKITPLDENIISKMRDCESIVLKMMDRLRLDNYEERKYLYLKHLRYWHHVLKEDSIGLFLASGIPHEVYDFIIYKLCKLKNIPTLLITYSTINGVSFISTDLDTEPALEIVKAYQEIMSQQPTEVVLSERFREHYDFQTCKEKDPIPWYTEDIPQFVVQDSLKLISEYLLDKIKNPFRTLKQFIDLQNLVHRFTNRIKYFQKSREIKTLFDVYDRNASDPDLQQKYIYLALHYQPECTTSPMAGVFVDQILMVEMIASLLPKNVYLYVKENPWQTWECRNKNFYTDLLKIPQVKLIPRTFNSFRLIEKCLAVATATGTVAWEGLFRGKPVLMFGQHFYQYAPKVFTVRNIEDCKFALHQIIDCNVKPSLDEMKMFLKAMENTAVIAYSDIAFADKASITDKENINNLFYALRNKIINLGILPLA